MNAFDSFLRPFKAAIHNPSFLYIAGSLFVFLCAILTYWITADSSVSYWDCPEYVITAYRLEIGHSPGNPTWSLFHNVVANLSEFLAGKEYIALGINLASGLFTALAMMLLYQTCFFCLRYLSAPRHNESPLISAVASLGASLSLTWADSPWFSAVEAEVYAMSLFFTALMLRVMIAYCRTQSPALRIRLLILEAFLIGLSIGVHELNLLAIPALALIPVFCHYRNRCRGKAWLSLFLAVGMVASILLGMYPGSTMIAGSLELFAVNRLNLPFNSGVILYLASLLVAVLAAPLLIQRVAPTSFSRKVVYVLALFLSSSLLLFLGGFFLLGSHILLSLVFSVVAAVILSFYRVKGYNSPSTIIWMVAACIVGFSSYLIIPIRGAANPPINENAPVDVFALYSYLKRDQYGSRPLIYGSTPYAKPLYIESIDSSGSASYKDYVRIPKRPIYQRAVPGARLPDGFGLIDSSQKKLNRQFISDAEAGRHRYVLSSMSHSLKYAPELDMWFPRLTSHDMFDINNYESWAGISKENMQEVDVSFALDSLGNPVGRLGSDGKRSREKSYKPTYLQNLQELFGYQIAYMYFRYLLWNFSGRQNDYGSAGEIEHGNFITGFSPLDDLMLGPQADLPPELSSSNLGRNPYFMIPFILGVAGAIVALRRGRRGKRADAVILTLFLMTGVAIVVYLNQDPGEPRERDYSFMGSFFAFSIWIAIGCSWLFSLASKLGKSRKLRVFAYSVASLITLGSPLWMLAVNFADHNRHGRYATTDYTYNILESLEPDAIIFVDGDNFTFPLWYTQEVLGIRRDVSVVSVTYLNTGWYSAQLQRPGEVARPVEMVASPQQIFYNAFAFVRPGLSSVDSVSADAVSELRRLYATPEGESPRLQAGALRIGPDSLLIDVHNILNGSHVLNQRWLSMLDIIASNAASDNPRPIYWHKALTSGQYAGFRPFTSEALFTRKLDLSLSQADSSAYCLDEAMRFLPNLKYGGADSPGIYFDPYVGEHVSRQRIALLKLADTLLKADRPQEALNVALICLHKFPSTAWPYQGMVIKTGVLWQEGLKLADIIEKAAIASNNKEALKTAAKLRSDEEKRIQSFVSWRNSLPQWRRNTLSKETRRIR